MAWGLLGLGALAAMVWQGVFDAPTVAAYQRGLSELPDLLPPASARLFEPDAGFDVLPVEVQEARDLLTELGVHEFSVDAELAKDAAMSQRLTEATYPLVRVETAAHVLRLVGPVPSGCVRLGAKTRVAVDRC